MPTLAEALRDRWPARIEGGAVKAAAWSAFEAMEKLPGMVATKRAEYGRRGDLSAKGINGKIRADLAQIVARDLRSHRQVVAERKAELKARREALAAPKVEKAESFADMVAEQRRAEVRTWLRSLPPESRHVALLGDHDGTLIEACLMAPPALSGLNALNETVRGQIVDAYLQNRHGETLAGMAIEEEGLTVAEAALRGALNELQDAVALPAHLFEGWLATGVDPELEAVDEHA